MNDIFPWNVLLPTIDLFYRRIEKQRALLSDFSTQLIMLTAENSYLRI
jgi:hypothetical protein